MAVVGGCLEWPTLLKVGSCVGLCHPSYSVGGELLALLVGRHSLSQSGTARQHTLLIRGVGGVECIVYIVVEGIEYHICLC